MLYLIKTKKVISILIFSTITSFLFFNSFYALAQGKLSGKVIEKVSGKPVANATVFLNNQTIATKTDDEGVFKLQNIAFGACRLVVSCVGFETYYRDITLSSDVQNQINIELNVKSMVLKEVKIQSTNSEVYKRNLQWFKDGFLGKTDLAGKCKILNPEVLDMIYYKKSDSLLVNSNDFVQIENDALGYNVKFLLVNFIRTNEGRNISYNGPVLFENLQGTPSQEKRWKKKRKDVYEGSSMHFFRSAVGNTLDEAGFRIFQFSIYNNLNRPPDSVVRAKIAQFSKLSKIDINKYIDSLEYWREMAYSQRIVRTLLNYPLNENEFIKFTNNKGVFALDCEKDGLFIVYNKSHHFKKYYNLDLLLSPKNDSETLVNFSDKLALFDNRGWILDPTSLYLTGAWGMYRVAGLLPTDYDPNQ